MRYFIYCRKSSEAEDRQVMSIESQLSTLRRTFGQNEAVDTIEVIEEAFSAKAPGRPLFNAMLTRVERGEADGIVAWAPDRLARNSIDGGRIVYLLDRGVIKDLKFATYTFENNSQGKFMLQIMFGQSKYYSDALSENVKRGNSTKLEKGWRPNQGPLGYLNDKASKTIVKDPDRFLFIRRMFELALSGSYSVRRICDVAREEWGFRTPLRKRTGGKPVALSGIYKILSNPFYAGMVVWGGKIYPGAHEPVVSIDEFNRLQALFRTPDKPKPKVREFAFTGVIHCGECGLLITAEQKTNRYGRQYIYYHCTKRRADYQCRQPSIRVEKLTEQIESFLATLQVPLKLHSWAVERLKELHTEQETIETMRKNSLERSLAETERALSNLTSLRLRDIISDNEFITERQRLETERLRLGQETHSAEQAQSAFEPSKSVISFSNRAVDCFRAGDANCKRLILNSVGSNLFLKDKTLNIEARKPLCQVPKTASFPQLRAVVDDIRTLYTSRDPDFMQLWEGIQKLDAMMPES
jgi:DNA invertase Pin-like site-specific DNA recombinase